MKVSIEILNNRGELLVRDYELDDESITAMFATDFLLIPKENEEGSIRVKIKESAFLVPSFLIVKTEEID